MVARDSSDRTVPGWNRLEPMTVEPGAPGPLEVLRLAVARHRDDGGVLAPRLLPDSPGHFIAIQRRQADVLQDEFRATCRVAAIACGPWAIWTSWPRSLQESRHGLGRVHIVIDYEEFASRRQRRVSIRQSCDVPI